MKAEQILEHLEEAAKKVGVRVCYEALSGDTLGQGGLCKVKGEWRAIIDRHASPGDKISLLSTALSTFDLESVFLPPEVRQVVERARPKAASAPEPV